MGRKKISQDILNWIEARKRFHLSHAHVQMARELGMNPKKLGKLDNHRQELWKAPLPQLSSTSTSRASVKNGPRSSCRSRNGRAPRRPSEPRARTTIGRGKAPFHWLDRIQGKKAMSVIDRE